MKRRYGYVSDNYKKWDVEVDITSVTSATSKHNQLDDQEQDARVILSGNGELLGFC